MGRVVSCQKISVSGRVGSNRTVSTSVSVSYRAVSTVSFSLSGRAVSCPFTESGRVRVVPIAIGSCRAGPFS